MPRWASRITLEVTGVRVERLHEIDDNVADCEAEGVREWARGACSPEGADIHPGDLFGMLWASIHGYDGPAGWNSNPWVWVVEFRRLP